MKNPRDCKLDSLLWSVWNLTEYALNWEHQQDWALYQGRKGNSSGKAPREMQSYFLCISGPGLLDFPVVDWTLFHDAQFLMVPDTHGFGVLHRGPRDDSLPALINPWSWLIDWLIERASSHARNHHYQTQCACAVLCKANWTDSFPHLQELTIKTRQ